MFSSAIAGAGLCVLPGIHGSATPFLQPVGAGLQLPTGGRERAPGGGLPLQAERLPAPGRRAGAAPRHCHTQPGHGCGPRSSAAFRTRGAGLFSMGRGGAVPSASLVPLCLDRGWRPAPVPERSAPALSQSGGEGAFRSVPGEAADVRGVSPPRPLLDGSSAEKGERGPVTAPLRWLARGPNGSPPGEIRACLPAR